MEQVSTNHKFRCLYIVDNRNTFQNIKNDFDPSKDYLVTFDFGLKKYLEEKEVICSYIDWIATKQQCDKNNFVIQEFLANWHIGPDGRDIFNYQGIDFGKCLKIEIWTDVVYYIRLFLNLNEILKTEPKSISVCSEDLILQQVLRDNWPNALFVNIKDKKDINDEVVYSFPIIKWMNSKQRPKKTSNMIFITIFATLNLIKKSITNLNNYKRKKRNIFVHEYYPTKTLIEKVIESRDLSLIEVDPSLDRGWMHFVFSSRYVPIFLPVRFNKDAKKLKIKYSENESKQKIFCEGTELTNQIHQLICYKLEKMLPSYIATLNGVHKFQQKYGFDLIVLISNIGKSSSLVQAVGKKYKVPTFLIINGMLGSDFIDESKDADFINSYSESIKLNYFKNSANVIALGDPRLDKYVKKRDLSRKNHNRSLIIGIGTAGFNSIDLNSFSSFEFEFFWDVLNALFRISKTSDILIKIKVRSNGYKKTYGQFLNEFFFELHSKVVFVDEMDEIYETADLYISTYSQTLFEASIHGIPAIFHHCDREEADVPFNGKSELVTTYTDMDLENCVQEFIATTNIFDDFLRSNVMEKYVGPLDGKSTERVFDFALKVMNGSEPGDYYS